MGGGAVRGAGGLEEDAGGGAARSGGRGPGEQGGALAGGELAARGQAWDEAVGEAGGGDQMWL